MARLTQLVAFLAVGLTGVGVNTTALWLLSAAWLNVPYLLASVLATNVAVIWNFVLFETYVFRKARNRSWLRGWADFGWWAWHCCLSNWVCWLCLSKVQH